MSRRLLPTWLEMVTNAERKDIRRQSNMFKKLFVPGSRTEMEVLVVRSFSIVISTT